MESSFWFASLGKIARTSVNEGREGKEDLEGEKRAYSGHVGSMRE